MPSVTGKSSLFGDTKAIAKDLLEGCQGNFGKNALGFLCCDARVDGRQLNRLVSQALPFPVVGGTSLIMPLTQNPEELSATLILFEKEGLSVSVSLTDPLDEDNHAAQVKQLYEDCLAGLPEAPKLLLPYIPLVPGMTADLFVNALFHLAGNTPVFGGMTTNDLDAEPAFIFAGGEAYEDRMLLVGLSGPIEPAFAMDAQLTLVGEHAPRVEASALNVVERVDGMPFCDYLRSIGITPEDRINGIDALVQYGPLPAQLKNKLPDDFGVPEIRCISYTDVEKGVAAFSSEMPPGTRFNLGLILREDVKTSAKRSVDTLKKQMETGLEKGYEYSLLLAVPCVARYFAMVGGDNVETKLLLENLPKQLSVSAYYGFYEIAPVCDGQGVLHNRSNNASIVLCAL
ncbi:hypothetical protein LJC49_04930 [Ruminococcaceae bacterium OttesenSCG-928-I18]|nr:hypothetical protein [Ruminococcaceae bacterium OttesenSCG-928-I18]